METKIEELETRKQDGLVLIDGFWYFRKEIVKTIKVRSWHDEVCCVVPRKHRKDKE